MARMSVLRQTAALVVLSAISCTVGCTSPSIRFLSSRCEAVREGDRLKTLTFVSTFEAANLKGEQLVYQVRVFDRDRVPLLSRDGRFQAADGAVAATKTMIVFTSPQTFTDVRVSIPASELSVPPNRLPVFAEIALLRPGGQRVAGAWRSLPQLRLSEIMPPMTTRPTPYWFVKVKDPNRLPVMLGPFASLAEAEAAVTEGTESPREIQSHEYLWFLPFHSQSPEQRVVLVGPCASEHDARDIAGLFTQMPDLARKGLVAGSPIEVQVQQWLKEREVNQILASQPAEGARDVPTEPPARRHR